MPVTTVFPPPNIFLSFQGILLTSALPGFPYADIGLVDNSDGRHPLNIKVRKLVNNTQVPDMLVDLDLKDGDVPTGRDLILDVGNRDGGGVNLYKTGTFDRSRPEGAGNDVNDFRWAIDFEGDEVYCEKVAVVLAGFRSFVRINRIGSGLFFVQTPYPGYATRSISQLRKVEGSTKTCLGRVAVRLAANFPLDSGGQSTFTLTGASPIVRNLPAKDGVTYTVDISQSCTDYAACGNDSSIYDKVITGNKAHTRKISFDLCPSAGPEMATRQQLTNELLSVLSEAFGSEHFYIPEAVCFPGTTGQTDLRKP
jgi:hypothetical protein